MVVYSINILVAVFLAIGAADYILNNRFGLGSEFERGFGCAGKLFITMGGFIALAPIIARVLAPAVSPFFRSIGAAVATLTNPCFIQSFTLFCKC